MATGARGDPADTVARVSGHWGWVLGFGIITLAIGIVDLTWPGRTLVVLAVLFGVQLIVMGIFKFARAIASDDLTSSGRVMLALIGVLSLIIGLYAVRHVLITLIALALLLGIFWIVSGAMELFMALSLREIRHRGWNALIGLLAVLAGLIVLVYPGISLLALAVVLGVWLMFLGAMQIMISFRIRSPSVHA